MSYFERFREYIEAGRKESQKVTCNVARITLEFKADHEYKNTIIVYLEACTPLIGSPTFLKSGESRLQASKTSSGFESRGT
jgi:hypothetical protein